MQILQVGQPPNTHNKLCHEALAENISARGPNDEWLKMHVHESLDNGNTHEYGNLIQWNKDLHFGFGLGF